MTRIGSSMRFTTVAAVPDSNADGVPVQDWKSVHVIFYADPATDTNRLGIFRVWRWYSKQVDGHAGASGSEVGWWIADYQITVALDPACVTPAISQHLEWPTRDAEKMYWQLVSVIDATTGAAATMPTFVGVQVFGNANQNDTIAVSVASCSGGGVAPVTDPQLEPFMAAVNATHWSPNDGTAIYLSPTTLITAGFPFIVDDVNCEVLGLVVRNAAGGVTEYVNGHDGISIGAVAGVVTVAGAPANPFVATDLDYYLYLVYQEKAYTEASDSYRGEEIAPLNTKYTQPAYIVDDTAIVADPAGGINVPSDDGIVMDGYKDIHFQIHLRGGQTDAGANRTITLKFQGSNDVEVGGVREWVDLGVGYDLSADATSASWTSLGLTDTDTQVDFDNWMGKRIRANYSFDDAPEADHPGHCVITERRKAL
jgi:hypothetical protein